MQSGLQMIDEARDTTLDVASDEPQHDDVGQLHAEHVTSNVAVIDSFADAATADIFRGRSSRAALRRLPPDSWRAAQRKMKALDVAARLQDLTIPARDRLERLRSDPARCSIPIDARYHLTFRWEQGHAHEVRIEAYR